MMPHIALCCLEGSTPEDKCLSLFIALRWMQRPERVMVWLTENIQACLRDFQTGTASMARKRHLASTARGLLCFCLMTLVTTGLIRSIRLIRGKEETSRGWGISVFIQLTQDFPGEQRNGGNNLPIGKTGKTFAASDLCTIFAPQKREDC